MTVLRESPWYQEIQLESLGESLLDFPILPIKVSENDNVYYYWHVQSQL